MSNETSRRLIYSRAELVSDAVVHITGLIAVALAVPTLIVVATLLDRGSVPLLSATIYGASFALMILCSAIYNMFSHPDWDWLLSRLDHSAIYLKIAGTYTPFAMISGQGLGLLAGLWGAALAGVSLKLVSPQRYRLLGLALYLGMGWVGVIAGWGIFAALPWQVVLLVAIGGVLYTVGVAFHLWDRLPFHNTIWHVFVLIASGVLYAAVMVALVAGGPITL